MLDGDLDAFIQPYLLGVRDGPGSTTSRRRSGLHGVRSTLRRTGEPRLARARSLRRARYEAHSRRAALARARLKRVDRVDRPSRQAVELHAAAGRLAADRRALLAHERDLAIEVDLAAVGEAEPDLDARADRGGQGGRDEDAARVHPPGRPDVEVVLRDEAHRHLDARRDGAPARLVDELLVDERHEIDEAGARARRRERGRRPRRARVSAAERPRRGAAGQGRCSPRRVASRRSSAPPRRADARAPRPARARARRPRRPRAARPPRGRARPSTTRTPTLAAFAAVVSAGPQLPSGATGRSSTRTCGATARTIASSSVGPGMQWIA